MTRAQALARNVVKAKVQSEEESNEKINSQCKKGVDNVIMCHRTDKQLTYLIQSQCNGQQWSWHQL